MALIDYDPQRLIDPAGFQNFSGLARRLRRDWDAIGLIVGGERTGKSTFAHIVCSIVDPAYCTSRIVFPTAELQMAISRAKPYSAVCQDEGAETWLAMDTNTQGGQETKRIFMEMGFKNLFIVICLPDIRLAEKYLKTHRIKFLVRIPKRGKYEYFDKGRIGEIRIDSVTKAVKWCVPSSQGYFFDLPHTGFRAAYLEKKAEHIGNRSEINPKVIEERLKQQRFMKSTVDLRTAGQIIGVNVRSVQEWINNGKLKKAHIKPIKTYKGWRIPLKDARHLRDACMGGSIDSILRQIEDTE